MTLKVFNINKWAGSLWEIKFKQLPIIKLEENIERGKIQTDRPTDNREKIKLKVGEYFLSFGLSNLSILIPNRKEIQDI